MTKKWTIEDWMANPLIEPKKLKEYDHDKLVKRANFVFDGIKERMELCQLPRDHMDEGSFAEVMDFAKDYRRVLACEEKIGTDVDCFALAELLLRAINRQWDGKE